MNSPQLHCPIGLDPGADTPEETALSIMAEIAARRRGGSGAPLRAGRLPLPHNRLTQVRFGGRSRGEMQPTMTSRWARPDALACSVTADHPCSFIVCRKTCASRRSADSSGTVGSCSRTPHVPFPCPCRPWLVI
ncbi:XdhC family protein [Streptomyces sp. NPDC090073]|uniref:XdhC family protein n=1 Tax=Streptomyces sp. NPDC090073 TaxID=3365936 RepID=UPI00380F38EF